MKKSLVACIVLLAGLSVGMIGCSKSGDSAADGAIMDKGKNKAELVTENIPDEPGKVQEQAQVQEQTQVQQQTQVQEQTQQKQNDGSFKDAIKGN